jgi:uncharacterized Zn-binding protein involved in type VI secretion
VSPPPRWPPAPPARSVERPHNLLHTVSEGINRVLAVPMTPVNKLNEAFAVATAPVAQVLPAFPAAFLGSCTVGMPHAHPLHPPSGPCPLPIPIPIPMPVMGIIALGTCVQVLINSLPAARCGDLGYNPTCFGIPPIFEVFTGSSNVFVGGARAARVLDITNHCTPVSAGSPARAMAAAMKAVNAASKAAQVAAITGDAVEAAGARAAGDGAMASALGMSAAMMAAQMAADAVATALSAAMGKDLAAPLGTFGAILSGSPNVLIGGFPMPTWANVAKGLLKLVRKLRGRCSSTHQWSRVG